MDPLPPEPPTSPDAAPGLSAAELDLLSDRFARNADYNDARLRLRRRLAAWGQQIAGALAEAGHPLEAHTSLHHPHAYNAYRVDHLRLYFSRNRRQRAALQKVLGASFRRDTESAYRHATLGISLTAEHLETALSIHPEGWWDAQNLTARVKKQDGRELAERLNRLAGYSLVVSSFREHPTGKLYRDQVEGALRYFKVGEHYLWVRKRWPRATVLAAPEAALVETLGRELVSLLPVYAWLAWSPENDLVFSGVSERPRPP